MPPSPGPSWLVPLIPLVFITTAGLESPAHADRFAIGASVGFSEGEGGTDRVEARGVLARVKLGKKLSLEGGLELVEQAEPEYTIQIICELRCSEGLNGRRASAALRYDLSSGTLRPYLIAGLAIESWKVSSLEFGYSRKELGIGLDVRLTDGLAIGGDVRWGERDYVGRRQHDDFAPAVYVPAPFGEEPEDYTAARATITAAF